MATRERITNESTAQAHARRVRRDSRQEESLPLGYENESGQLLRITGDDVAPYVKIAGSLAALSVTLDEPIDINDLPPATAVVGSSLSLSRSTALEDDRIVKAAAGTLYSMRALLAAASGVDLWLMAFNKATAPTSASEVPIWSAVLPAGSLEVAEEVPWGMFCSAGISIAISSTLLVYTSAGNIAVLQAAYR